jgi:hypothetical protein
MQFTIKSQGKTTNKNRGFHRRTPGIRDGRSFMVYFSGPGATRSLKLHLSYFLATRIQLE